MSAERRGSQLLAALEQERHRFPAARRICAPQRQRRDAELVKIHGNLPDGLNGIDVHRNSPRQAGGGERAEFLNDAGLIVREDDRDKAEIGCRFPPSKGGAGGG